jgi:hypothetical protein
MGGTVVNAGAVLQLLSIDGICTVYVFPRDPGLVMFVIVEFRQQRWYEIVYPPATGGSVKVVT